VGKLRFGRETRSAVERSFQGTGETDTGVRDLRMHVPAARQFSFGLLPQGCHA
jgi:hypothetical protein